MYYITSTLIHYFTSTEAFVEFENSTPIYIQIMNEIKRRLISGELKPGDKVPSTRDLAAELRVNPNTISKVYQSLEAEGITETRRGMGTYIAQRSEEETALMKNESAQNECKKFLKKMTESGFAEKEIISLLQKIIKAGEY